MRGLVAWLVFWAGFGFLDRWAAKRGASLCAASRVLFHTDHPLGRVAFATSLGAGSGVLMHHILSGETEATRVVHRPG